jgi:hypothetical protein
VLWILVALNFLLGKHENVPFSTFAMFSSPSKRAWTLRFEGPNGELVPIGTIGLAPHAMRKRFEAELKAARARGDDIGAARRSAAEVVAALLEQRRPLRGPLATRPITIVLMEYVLESGRLCTVRTPVMETTPR